MTNDRNFNSSLRRNTLDNVNMTNDWNFTDFRSRAVDRVDRSFLMIFLKRFGIGQGQRGIEARPGTE